MATTAGTSPTEVRKEIDTGLTDPDISDVLDLVERDIDRTYPDPDFEDDQHRIDFEAVLAALRIAEGLDRRAETESRESASITYETREVETIRKRVRRRDPGDAFGHPGNVRRDTDRYVTSTDL